MRQLMVTKMYFGVIEIYFKYMLNIFWQKYFTYIKKIYAKYILIVQLLAKIYFIHFDIYLTYILFPCEVSPVTSKTCFFFTFLSHTEYLNR